MPGIVGHRFAEFGTRQPPITPADTPPRPVSPKGAWLAALQATPDGPLEVPQRALALPSEQPWEGLRLRPSDAALDDLHRTLATGVQDAGGRRIVYGDGVNGAIPGVDLIDGSSGRRVAALVKTIEQGGAQEVFGSEVARAMHVEHLVPAAVRRADGAAIIEVRPGEYLRDMRVRDARDLEVALRHAHQVRDPGAAPGVVARRARIDRQLAHTFDYLLANGDRHRTNALFDAEQGVLSLIDNGLLDKHDPVDGVVKLERSLNLMRGVDELVDAHGVVSMQLDDEVVALLEQVDRPRIVRAFTQMASDQAGAASVGAYARASTPAFLEQLLGRLDDAIRLRAIRFRF